jgi:predicted RNase H-like HicB family nuclease
MAKYVYPAVFTPEENGLYAVTFPDLAGCRTSGDTLADAVEMAEDALCLMLYDMEETGKDIPAPSAMSELHTENGDIVSLVACDTLEYRKSFDKKAIKKTLTLPNWLNTLAERDGVNFSAVLQEALIAKLNLDA